MATNQIDSFRSALVGGGARPSQFKVTLSIPGASANISEASEFLVKAASLPSSQIQTIEVPWRGRMAKIAGERMFQNWQVTVLNDTDFTIRDALMKWSAAILHHEDTYGEVNPVSYITNSMMVRQLGRSDKVLSEYTFHNVWPVSIGEIGLNFADNSSIEEYQVEFSVDYWVSDAVTASTTNILQNITVNSTTI